jgi:hypothetical protein
MRRGVNVVIALFALMLFAVSWAGCSKKSEPPASEVNKAQPPERSVKVVSKDAVVVKSALPADEVIIKAIDDSGIMNRPDGKFTVVPPVKIVEKGKQNKDGSWPVKARFTLKYKMKDGKVSPPTETTTLFTIFEEKDNAGNSVWKAQIGS